MDGEICSIFYFVKGNGDVILNGYGRHRLRRSINSIGPSFLFAFFSLYGSCAPVELLLLPMLQQYLLLLFLICLPCKPIQSNTIIHKYENFYTENSNSNNSQRLVGKATKTVIYQFIVYFLHVAGQREKIKGTRDNILQTNKRKFSNYLRKRLSYSVNGRPSTSHFKLTSISTRRIYFYISSFFLFC